MKARRSWLVVPAHRSDALQSAAASAADVLVLDLEYSVPPKTKVDARAGLGDLIASLPAVERDVFVRIDRETRWADVRAAIHRGVRGIVFPGAEEAEEVAELDRLIATLERERGIETGSIEQVLMLESAKGFWNVAALAQASPRVSALGVGRIDLTMQLGPVPQEEFRLYRYLMTRTLVAARAFGKDPLGAHWRPGSRGGEATDSQTAKAAREARLMGFRGCLCAQSHQVGAVNAAFAAG